MFLWVNKSLYLSVVHISTNVMIYKNIHIKGRKHLERQIHALDVCHMTGLPVDQRWEFTNLQISS